MELVGSPSPAFLILLDKKCTEAELERAPILFGFFFLISGCAWLYRVLSSKLATQCLESCREWRAEISLPKEKQQLTMQMSALSEAP